MLETMEQRECTTVRASGAGVRYPVSHASTAWQCRGFDPPGVAVLEHGVAMLTQRHAGNDHGPAQHWSGERP